jgi:hypothetical protein
MAARALAEKILAHELGEAFAVRDVYRRHWAGLATREEVIKAVVVLVDLGWLAEQREAMGGRPSQTYVVNPQVFGSGDARDMA